MIKVLRSALTIAVLFLAPNVLAAVDTQGEPAPIILTEEVLKNAWAAMDQAYPPSGDCWAYEKLALGTLLRSPDNLARDRVAARKMPWDIANTFKVTFDSGITQQNGRVIVYVDDKNGMILVSFMGTNGIADFKGWIDNSRDLSFTQFIAYARDGSGNDLNSLDRLYSDAVTKSTRDLKARGVSPRIIFVGDSKGGLQAQLALSTYLRARDDFSKAVPAMARPEDYVANVSLALVAHSSPGASFVEKRYLNMSDPKRYDGIEMHYSFARFAGILPDVASLLGGDYLGVGSPGSKARVYQYDTRQWTIFGVHRLAASGYDFFNGTGARFADMTPTTKPGYSVDLLPLADAARAIDGAFAISSTLRSMWLAARRLMERWALVESKTVDCAR